MVEPGHAVRGRLPNLDVLRGLAALLVLVGHSYGLGGRSIPVSAEWWYDGILLLTPIGVWLFFAMSGLLIAKPFIRALAGGTPRPSTIPYALRRIGRIYPLYLVCAAVTLLVIGFDTMGPKTTIAHLLLLHNLVPGREQAFIGVTWTLSLEVLFYIAVPVLAAAISLVCRRRPVTPARMARWIVGSAVLSMMWMYTAGYLSQASASGSLWLRLSLPSMWSAFCPGLLVAVLHVSTAEDRERSIILRALQRLRTDTTAALTVGGAAFTLAFLSGYAQVEWGTTTYLWLFDTGRVLWTIVFGIVVLRAVELPALEARTPRPLQLIGDWSYGVYLIHGTFLTIILFHTDGSLIPMFHGGAVAFVVHLVFVLAVTLPLSWLSWHLIEKPAMTVSRPRPRDDALAAATT